MPAFAEVGNSRVTRNLEKQHSPHRGNVPWGIRTIPRARLTRRRAKHTAVVAPEGADAGTTTPPVTSSCRQFPQVSLPPLRVLHGGAPGYAQNRLSRACDGSTVVEYAASLNSTNPAPCQPAQSQ